VGALALVSAAGVAACGVSGGATPAAPAKLKEPASLLYWTILGGADGTRMRTLTEQYQQQTPLVKVEDIQGVPDFLQKFIASVVAGSPPDIITIRMTYIPGFVEKNALLDLQPKELQHVGLRTEDFDATVWKSSEYKGKRYALPFDIHGYQFYYNASAVREGGLDPEKPPVTWQEWQEWTSKLTVGERHGSTMNSGGAGLFWQFHGHLRQAAKALGSNADLFTPDGTKPNFNNPAGNAALSLMADLWKRAKHPLPSGPGNGRWDLFERRQLAGHLDGCWNLNRVAQPENPAANDVRVVLSPQRDAAKPSWWAQSHQIALPKAQKVEENKRAAAFDFARWLTEHTFEWSKAGQVPASRKVLASEQYQKSDLLAHKWLRVWEKNLPSASFMPLHPKFLDFEERLPAALAPAVRNETSPQSALAEAEQLANQVLAQ